MGRPVCGRRSRLAVWFCMHFILWRIRQLEAVPGIAADDTDVLTNEHGGARASFWSPFPGEHETPGRCDMGEGYNALSLW